jgi:hypothetical protein
MDDLKVDLKVEKMVQKKVVVLDKKLIEKMEMRWDH